MTAAVLDLRPDPAVMLSHLEWIVDPVRHTHADTRVEIAWGRPDSGPNHGKTFAINQLESAAAHAAQVNSEGNNVYVGVTLKRTDTPTTGRTRSEHAAVATNLPIDIDDNLYDVAVKIG